MGISLSFKKANKQNQFKIFLDIFQKTFGMKVQ